MTACCSVFRSAAWVCLGGGASPRRRVARAEMLQALCVVRGGALPRGTAAPFTHPSQREAR
eukprot:COSAG06_NODE_9320_length_1929_cov_3.907650_2_plen_60_part_01